MVSDKREPYGGCSAAARGVLGRGWGFVPFGRFERSASGRPTLIAGPPLFGVLGRGWDFVPFGRFERRASGRPTLIVWP